jgi:HK97 family phage prohead protease
MEIKNLKQDDFAVEGRTIVGYAAAFGNRDRVGDIIEQGAFKKTISERQPKVFYNHSYPIGLPLAMREDSKGLYTESKISATPRGDEILELVKDGVISEMSIAYEVVKFDVDRTKDTRMLKELKLYEFGLLTSRPMSRQLLPE